MEIHLAIKYNWTCDQGVDPIPEKHREALKDNALERICEMIGEGYASGELNTAVRFGEDEVPEEDGDYGLTYSGWWGINQK